jgi:tripartite-type tricarboxylate transporter receptor subunit TctC
MKSQRTFSFSGHCGKVFILLLSIALTLCGLRAEAALKADFPGKGKTVTLVVATSAGGSTDIGARLLAGPLEKELGCRVQIENKPGAGHQVGLTAVSRSKPDGYTIAMSVLPQTLTLYLDPERKAIFNRKSFQPLGMQVIDPGTFAVKTDSPYKTIKDVIAAAKASPGKIRVSATGIMSDDHLAVMRLQKLTGAKFAIVQFDGSAPSMAALLGGHTDLYTGNIGDTVPQFKTGEIRVLGIMDDEESPFLPGIKTLESQGIKLISSSSRGIVAPAGVPKEIANILANAIKKAIDNEAARKKMEEQGLTVRYMDPAKMEAYWTEMEEQVKPFIDEAKKK